MSQAPEHRSIPSRIECGGYPVLNALHPTPENAALHVELQNHRRPFGALGSQKITIVSRQTGKRFGPRQIRIRGATAPYSLLAVIKCLVRTLRNNDHKSDEDLRSWRLDRIDKISGRKATFQCVFQEDAGEPAVQAQEQPAHVFVPTVEAFSSYAPHDLLGLDGQLHVGFQFSEVAELFTISPGAAEPSTGWFVDGC